MKRTVLMLLLLLVTVPVSFAQSERRSVRAGNRHFRKEKLQESEIDYKKAIVADSLSCAAHYNLGNAYFRMENYAEADKAFAAVKDSIVRTDNAASFFHNTGCSMLAQKNWQGAVDAFKDALRRNPDDMETKANLAYAQKMLENEQQNQDQDQNQNQNQDQNQDQNQNQNQNQVQNQNQNQDQNRQQPQNDGNRQPKISQQDARQMLQAIQAQEKDTQEKVKKEKAILLQTSQKEKNW